MYRQRTCMEMSGGGMFHGRAGEGKGGRVRKPMHITHRHIYVWLAGTTAAVVHELLVAVQRCA